MLKILKNAQSIFLRLKKEATEKGIKNAGRIATNQLKAHACWPELENYIQHSKALLMEQRLIGGCVCTECGNYWTAARQQGICELCFSQDPRLKETRKTRMVAQRKQTSLDRYGHENPVWSKEIRQAITEKWGVENPMQLKHVQEKTKATKAARYDGGHEMRDPEFRARLLKQRGYIAPFERSDVREKSRETWMRNGYHNPSQDKAVHQRKIETLLARAGVISPSQEDDYLDKVRATHLKNSGGIFTHHMQNPEVLTQALKSGFKVHSVSVQGRTFEVQGMAEEVALGYLVNEYGIDNVLTQFDTAFPIKKAAKYKWTPDFYVKGHGFFEAKTTWTLYTVPGTLDKNREKAASTPSTWLVVYNKKHVVRLPENWYKEINVPTFAECCFHEQYPQTASFEQQLLAWCLRFRPDAELRNGTVFVESCKIAIEAGHLYWQSTAHLPLKAARSRFAERQKKAHAKGWRLVRIWEHKWKLRKTAARSYIQNLLDQAARIAARKCTIVVKSLDEVREFMHDNHIQGAPRTGVAHCLMHDDQLVACMIFSRIVSVRGTHTDSGFELTRFASSVPVQGGASRLLSHFRKTHKGTIISYSDNQMFSGAMYETLGFTRVSEVEPTYQSWWGGTLVRSKQATKRDRLAHIEGFDPVLSEYENCKALSIFRIYDSGKIKWQLD